MTTRGTGRGDNVSFCLCKPVARFVPRLCAEAGNEELRFLIRVRKIRSLCFVSRGGKSNPPRHRIAALLRFGINEKGRVWAARGALGR